VPALDHLGAEDLRRTVVTFRDTMKRHAAGINRLNVYPVPDGDTGTNMARTLDAVVAELDSASEGMEQTCKAISHGSLMGARGNSGVILSQILRGMASTLSGVSGARAGAVEVADSLKTASVAAYEAVLKPIEGTILTVVREAADAAVESARGGATLSAMLQAARTAGRAALDRTPEMLPVLKDAGVVDAGGAGFLLLLDSAIHVVDGEPLPEPEVVDGPSAAQLEAVAHRHAEGTVDVSELRYEVMFFLELEDSLAGAFKTAWGGIGDSIVVVGGEGIYNCHIHTNDIGAAIEAMGVHGVVTGGQTMNPSTQELLDAVEHMNATQVVILPNNKNIIAVAQQVDGLTTKDVRVVPTCSMPEGLAALVAYDPEASAEHNGSQMAAAASAVATGEVTTAVRDTQSEAGPVREGDVIGIVRGDGVVAVSREVATTCAALLDRLVDDGRELVTIITGDGASAATTERISAWLAEHRPGVAIEVHDGGQPLYPYLFGVE